MEGIGRRRRRGQQRMMVGITNLMDMSLSKLRELVIDRRPGVLRFMGSQRVRHDWVTELNWTENHYQWWLQPWNWKMLAPWKKAMTNPDSILKSRDITLATKVPIVKAMAFTVVMYGCESWTIKKAERWRIDAFKLWCWRRLLRVPWTARRSI